MFPGMSLDLYLNQIFCISIERHLYPLSECWVWVALVLNPDLHAASDKVSLIITS